METPTESRRPKDTTTKPPEIRELVIRSVQKIKDLAQLPAEFYRFLKQPIVNQTNNFF